MEHFFGRKISPELGPPYHNELINMRDDDDFWLLWTTKSEEVYATRFGITSHVNMPFIQESAPRSAWFHMGNAIHSSFV